MQDEIQLGPQAIFDEVVEHLAKQGKRSMMPNPLSTDNYFVCAYRGEGGLQCAAGIFIPEKYYSKDFECNGIKTVVNMLPGCKLRGGAERHIMLVNRLQSAHDNGFSLMSLRLSLIAVAGYFGLSEEKLSLLTKWKVGENSEQEI